MRLLGLFFFAAMISVFLNFHNPERSVLINLFVGLLAVKAIAEHYDFDMTKLTKTLFVFCAVSDLFIVLQHFGIDPLYQKYFAEASGLMIMPWLSGAAAVLCLPFLKGKKALITIPMFLISASKLCVLTGVLVYCVAQNVKLSFKWIGLIVILGLSYVVIFDPGFDSIRLTVWMKSLKYLHNPIVGNGLGSWCHEGFAKANGETMEHWRWAVNDGFQLIFETGLLGFLAAFAVVVRWFRDRFRASIALALICISTFHPVFHFPCLLPLIVLLVAYLTLKSVPEPLSPAGPNTTSPR